ncbi:class D beta-lactamase [Roseateles amylovorans]|uniref:Beta-lactamase n=1 Tax=Roseateles amylovorans TaxID=2978473 RepID=A0ABY6B3D8_9BURK|nr:class D beta-lactamase [Roseateles amylovorans]UXH79704.1 class D beta-lactamase [Roseateles amylovorans]
MNTRSIARHALLIASILLTACRAATAQAAPPAEPAPQAATARSTEAIPMTSRVAAASRERWETRPQWQRGFSELDTQGTLVLLDTRQHRWLASDARRAFEGFLPASTFKIPMSLIALETGIAQDETAAFTWDGKKRSLSAWNQDQTLASAYQVSAVWVFQHLARQVGQTTVQQFLYDFRYGNAIAGPVGDSFWLDGHLRISAVGQIEFLRRLHDRALPLSDRTYDIARKVMLRDQGPGWKIFAKTGWAADTTPAIGWFVGWVEQDKDPRPVYFALNMNMSRSDLARQREEIVKRTLRELSVLE